MAVTVTIAEKFVFGAHEIAVADVVFDSSYSIGGEAVTAANFGFEREITHVVCGVARDPDTADNAFVCDYDDTNSKLILFYSNSDAADGPLIELPNTTDGSAYTARVLAIGK